MVEKNESKTSGNLTQFLTSLKDKRAGSITLESWIVIKHARRAGGPHSIITLQNELIGPLDHLDTVIVAVHFQRSSDQVSSKNT